MTQPSSEVRDYIEGQPDDWQPTLRKLRASCRKHLSGYTEVFTYGMPGYQRTEVEVSFAQQAHYLSLYILNKTVMDSHRPQLAGLNLGKGCIRYRSPEQIDWEVVASLLESSAAGDADMCGR
jgi:uncharacterized protein YdhG (YjbR/CyaY superfamily)